MEEKVSMQKINRILFFGVLTCVILYYAQRILIPITFSIFFAMLFTPLANRMEAKGINRVFSSLISLLILIVISFGIGLLVYMQAKRLVSDFPVIEKKIHEFMIYIQSYLNVKLDLSTQTQDNFINEQIQSLTSNIKNALMGIFSALAGVLTSSFLVVIFTFLFLLQRDKYESFFIQISGEKRPDEAKKLIGKISKVSQNYLVGRTLSVLLFTFLFTIGFLIVGLKSAFLLAFIAALLTIVPYIGAIVGGLLPFAIALITEDSTNVAIGALAVVLVIQSVDNYFIEPYIIGGEVNISGFFSILILLIGGILWGVAGMVLFLPMLGVTKIICDSLPALKPYGFLIGDQEDGKQSKRLWESIKKLFGK